MAGSPIVTMGETLAPLLLVIPETEAAAIGVKTAGGILQYLTGALKVSDTLDQAKSSTETGAASNKTQEIFADVKRAQKAHQSTAMVEGVGEALDGAAGVTSAAVAATTLATATGGTGLAIAAGIKTGISVTMAASKIFKTKLMKTGLTHQETYKHLKDARDGIVKMQDDYAKAIRVAIEEQHPDLPPEKKQQLFEIAVGFVKRARIPGDDGEEIVLDLKGISQEFGLCDENKKFYEVQLNPILALRKTNMLGEKILKQAFVNMEKSPVLQDPTRRKEITTFLDDNFEGTKKITSRDFLEIAGGDKGKARKMFQELKSKNLIDQKGRPRQELPDDLGLSFEHVLDHKDDVLTLLKKKQAQAESKEEKVAGLMKLCTQEPTQEETQTRSLGRKKTVYVLQNTSGDDIRLSEQELKKELEMIVDAHEKKHQEALDWVMGLLGKVLPDNPGA
ncbi:MAG: hypothetical protein VW378_04895 [bacterium]